MFQDIKVCIIEAEDLPEASMKYEITAVPTFLILRDGKRIDRMDGADATNLTNKIKMQVCVI